MKLPVEHVCNVSCLKLNKQDKLNNYFDKTNQLKNIVTSFSQVRRYWFITRIIALTRKKWKLDCMGKIQNIITENTGKGFYV